MNKTLLVFDCESTGLVRSKSPLTDPAQPHIVSLSALQVQVTDSDMYIQQSMSKLVTPTNWEWDDSETSEDRAFAVHKLPVDYCAKWGRSEEAVLEEFLELWNNECELVAHNLKFDAGLISCAIARHYGQGEVLSAFLNSEGFCTMNESAPIVDARGAKGQKKKPNLKEAYEFFTGNKLIDHHSANRDAVAALEVWIGIHQHP